jgi:hypothetical protein
MTTGEFIKLLQKEDPDGTAHLRMSGGIPKYVVHKEGYYDGPYSYFDKEGNWVYSIQGSKVDVYCEDIEGFVSNKLDTYQIPTWESIKEKFKFELGGYSVESQRNERAEGILKQAKEAYDDMLAVYEGFQDRYEKIAVERANAGWKFYQDMEVDNPDIHPNLHHYYTWLIYDENGKFKGEGSCVADTQAVYKSGLFERKASELVHGYYEWTLKK